jgi:hypothetical protein
MLTYDEVTELASDMGRSTATWVKEAGRVLEEGKLNDCDPKILDAWSPRSWEWAGESMAQILALTGDESADDIDDMASHFKEVADSAYWFEIERICLFHTTED